MPDGVIVAMQGVIFGEQNIVPLARISGVFQIIAYRLG
jgi:hypothetical protein